MDIEYNKINYDNLQSNESANRLYNILQKWIPFVDGEFKEWSGRPNSGHFFGGSYFYGVETAIPMFLYAIMSKLGDYNESITGVPRYELEDKAIKCLRYLTFTHDLGPKDCFREKSSNVYANGTKWGGKGDEFFRATAVGRTGVYLAICALMFRDKIEDCIFNIIEQMIIAFSDRWSAELPRAGTYFDTQSEENAWTALGIAGGLVLFKNHPNRQKWLEGFNRWCLNSIGTYKDRMNTGTYDEKSLRNFWMKGVTFHPDHTTENHSFVHPGYVTAGIILKFESALLLKMTGNEIPQSVFINNEKIFNDTLSRWCQNDGILIPIQGQDWWYTRYHTDHIMHSIMSVIHGSENSAAYLHESIIRMEQLQDSHIKHTLLEDNPDQKIDEYGHYSLKDMEHGSVLGLINTFLIHTYFGEKKPSKNISEINDELKGIYEYPFGCTIINRQKNSFSNFNWRNKVMAVNLPKDGLWTITPIIASMTGEIQFTDRVMPDSLCNERDIRDSVKRDINVKPEGFGATCTVVRDDEKLFQDISFVSLPNGITVYTDKFTVNKDFKTTKFHGGLIGIRNENIKYFGDIAKGYVNVFTGENHYTFKGWFGGENDDIEYLPQTGMVNIDDKMGYVYFGSNGVKYVNRHHYIAWKGVEDQLVFNNIDDRSFKKDEKIEPFTLIAGPNQSHEDTNKMQKSTIRYSTDNENTFVYEVCDYLIICNFNHSPSLVEAECKAASEINIYPGETRIENGKVKRIINLKEYRSDYQKQITKIKIEINSNFRVFSVNDSIFVENFDDNTIKRL